MLMVGCPCQGYRRLWYNCNVIELKYLRGLVLSPSWFWCSLYWRVHMYAVKEWNKQKYLSLWIYLTSVQQEALHLI